MWKTIDEEVPKFNTKLIVFRVQSQGYHIVSYESGGWRCAFKWLWDVEPNDVWMTLPLYESK